MRGLVIGGGLLGLLLTVGIMLYIAFGASTGGPSTGPDGAAPARGSIGAALNAKKAAEIEVGLAVVRNRLEAYRALNDRYPASLAELEKEGPLPKLPSGMSYQYDAKTGAVEAR